MSSLQVSNNHLGGWRIYSATELYVLPLLLWPEMLCPVGTVGAYQASHNLLPLRVAQPAGNVSQVLFLFLFSWTYYLVHLTLQLNIQFFCTILLHLQYLNCITNEPCAPDGRLVTLVYASIADWRFPELLQDNIRPHHTDENWTELLQCLIHP